jgi:hypothetical protein
MFWWMFNKAADRTGFWLCEVVQWLVFFTINRHFILMRWKSGAKHSLFEQWDWRAWSWSRFHCILMQVQVPDRVWICCFNIVKCHHLMMLIKRWHTSQTWLGYCDETFEVHFHIQCSFKSLFYELPLSVCLCLSCHCTTSINIVVTKYLSAWK